MLAGLYHYGMPADRAAVEHLAAIASAAGAANCLKIGSLTLISGSYLLILVDFICSTLSFPFPDVSRRPAGSHQ
jgi:hypothetical protein